MPILDYTTPEDIRGALGVDNEELGDETVLLQVYEDTLYSELDQISYSFHDFYMGFKAVAVLTGAEERFMRYSRLFATYAVARALTHTLPMFGPKSIEDGKAKVERFSDPYKKTIEAVSAEYERWRALAQEAFRQLGEEGRVSVRRIYGRGVSPAYNPITNE